MGASGRLLYQSCVFLSSFVFPRQAVVGASQGPVGSAGPGWGEESPPVFCSFDEPEKGVLLPARYSGAFRVHKTFSNWMCLLGARSY